MSTSPSPSRKRIEKASKALFVLAGVVVAVAWWRIATRPAAKGHRPIVTVAPAEGVADQAPSTQCVHNALNVVAFRGNWRLTIPLRKAGAPVRCDDQGNHVGGQSLSNAEVHRLMDQALAEQAAEDKREGVVW